MTKKKFLEELEKKLEVLEESEKQDILDEYKDIIAEKVKNGKTEKEAISDFGSVDELSKEILSAYKINPEYDKNKEASSGEKAKEIVDSGEQLIKEGAKKLSSFTKNVIDDVKESNKDFTIDLVFEIIIKVILLLIGFAILRLPFMFIEALGSSILDFAFYPMDQVLTFIWSGLIGILYFATCIVIAIIVFKQYFKPSQANDNKQKTSVKKEKKQTINESKEKNKTKEEKIIKEKNSSDSATSVFLILVKIFVIAIFLIPLFFVNIGLVSALALFIFLFIKGLNVIGFLIFIIGLMTITGYISALIVNLLFERKKIYIFPFTIGMFLLVIGGIVIVDRVTDINYHNSLPHHTFDQQKIVYNEVINSDTYIRGDIDDKEIIINNNLDDNKVVIEVLYYNDLVNLNRRVYSYGDNSSIDISTEYNNLNKRTLFELILNELKNNRIYNYGDYFDVDIRIYANENTIKLIK